MTKENTSEEVQPKTRRVKTRTKLIIGASIIIIIIGALAWLYTGNLTSAKQKVFQTLPLPVALVESKTVGSTELFARVNLAKELLAKTGQNTEGVEKEILDQLIETEKVEILAARRDVSISNEDVENAYQGILKQFPGGDEKALTAELQSSYGLDLNTFKNEVLKQTVTREKLSLWFNGQESLNTESYLTARDLLKQLDEGASFDEVATKYSADQGSQAFAGDSGFVAYSDLLPEFKAAVDTMAINDTRIVASRYGIHVLRLNAIADNEQGTEKRYNLQQIFLAPSDFNVWLANESAKIKSVKFL